MDWEDKVEMIDLLNKSKNDELGTKIFHDYILEHMNVFDDQSWDMFISGIDLIPDEMKPYTEFYTKLYSCVKKIQSPSIRIAMRIARLEQICEEDLKINKNVR